MIEFKPLVDLADKLGVIQAVKEKLVQQRDPAVEKFIIALEEISKLYSATESELARYLSVWLEKGADNRQERELLVSLESGPLLLRWSSARGHCHKLNNIYKAHLDKWFVRFLKPEELDQIRILFGEFAIVEGGFVENLDALTRWLSGQATETLDLLDNGRVEEANTHIREARKAILPFRQQINEAMQGMLQVQADLIELLGVA